MPLPVVLKNFNVYVDGFGFAGLATEVTPPKLTLMTEEHKAGGMDAAADIDMGMEKPSLEFTLAEYNANVIKRFGLIAGGDVPVTLRGAMQGEAGAVVPLLINARGLISEIDKGTWKVGDATTMKVAMSLRYYKETHAGAVLVELDIEGMKRIIDGVDQLAEQRAAIGL